MAHLFKNVEINIDHRLSIDLYMDLKYLFVVCTICNFKRESFFNFNYYFLSIHVFV